MDPILTARSCRLFCQRIRNWGIKLTSVTHTTILHKQLYSHTLLYSLALTTILSHIPNYILSHTLIYSLNYRTKISHKHDYTVSYIHVKGVLWCVCMWIVVFMRDYNSVCKTKYELCSRRPLIHTHTNTDTHIHTHTHTHTYKHTHTHT